MSWRTIYITKSAKLDYQLGYMVVRQESTSRIHLDEVRVLVIESTAISITGALLCELMKKKVKVVFCDEKRNPSSELIPYYGSHDTSAKIKKQISWSRYIKDSVWTEIVTEKIRKQYALLKILHLPEAELLEEYIKQIEFADATNREGHAAKVYFNALFGKTFSRSDDNSINAALNYGYSLILSACSREIVSNGYLTQLGLFHDNMFNQFNLASDLMEPFRPLVDNCVKSLCPVKFEKEEKIAVLQLLNDNVMIGNKNEVVLNAIKIYIRSVFDALNECDVSLIKFYKNEL